MKPVYLDCPVCGGSVPDPFWPGSLQRGRHLRRSGADPCRFVVSVDPQGGDNHEFYRLSGGESYEDGMSALANDHDRRIKQGLGLSIARDYAS